MWLSGSPGGREHRFVTNSKIRLRFTKKGEVRFLSHHDLMRFFERAIRRAGLPVKMSQGFNPRPKFSIAAALGVGVAAESEILDVELAEPMDPELVRQKLAGMSIPGIELLSAEPTPGKTERVASARYEVLLPPEVELPADAVDTLMARQEVPVERAGKDKQPRRINIRPYIREIHIAGHVVRMQLEITDSGAARPEEVVLALAADQKIDRNRLKIVRTALETEPVKKS